MLDWCFRPFGDIGGTTEKDVRDKRVQIGLRMQVYLAARARVQLQLEKTLLSLHEERKVLTPNGILFSSSSYICKYNIWLTLLPRPFFLHPEPSHLNARSSSFASKKERKKRITPGRGLQRLQSHVWRGEEEKKNPFSGDIPLYFSLILPSQLPRG